MTRFAMRRLVYSCAVIFLLQLFSVFAQSLDYLFVLDPRQGWNRAKGRIEEVLITARPRGLYMEYGMFLTISAKGTFLDNTSYQNLEIVLNFGLPANAIVVDSWLWVGDSIMQAQIKEYGTAATIYETIVGMRRDPSFLAKVNDRYELRVYPLAGTRQRKVKITYLVPMDWSDERVRATLPLNVLKTSSVLPPITLRFWGNNFWQNPQVDEAQQTRFNRVEDAVNGAYWETVVAPANSSQNLTFSVSSPLRNGFYLSSYHNGKEGYYQMAFLPKDVLRVQTPSSKTCIVVDFDQSKSSITLAQTLQALQTQLLANATPKDSFNLMYSKLTIGQASNSWMALTRENLEFAWRQLQTGTLYNNLPALLVQSMNYTRQSGGKILLVANTDRFRLANEADQLLTDLRLVGSSNAQVSVIDFCERSQTTIINAQTYFGNEYFYSKLTEPNNGKFARVLGAQSMSESLQRVINATNPTQTIQADFLSAMSNGPCYYRFDIVQPSLATSVVAGRTSGNNLSSLENIVLQTGKYVGTPPFSLIISGSMNNLPIGTIVTATTGQIEAVGGTNEQVWVANYISSLAPRGIAPSNTVVREITAKSLEYRVLSNYTAFLALEPNDTLRPCSNCSSNSDNQRGSNSGGTAQTSVPLNTDNAGLECTISPNPFSAEASLEFTLQEPLTGANGNQLTICNVLGQSVTSISLERFCGQKSFNVHWNGLDSFGNPVPTGIYFVIFKSSKGIAVWKIVKSS